MAKRRTKRQKAKAKHQFLIRQGLSEKTSPGRPVVKKEFKKPSKHALVKNQRRKKAVSSAKESIPSTIGKDLTKSLFLAGLILSLEIVLYFVL